MMMILSESECLFYGGIVVMAIVGVLTVLSVIIFTLTGRSIKKELEQEYGEIRGKQKCPK